MEPDVSDKSQVAPSSLTQNEAGGWPGGWYIYENGKVDGPFAAEDAFKMETETVDGKPRLISRKGFSQWYALKDLSEIFKMTDQMGRKAQSEMLATEARLQAQATPVVVPPAPKAAQKAPASLVTPVDAKPAEATASAGTMPTTMATPSVFPASAQQHIPTQKARKIQPTAIAKAELMQGYFLARGRLRLGKLRNPWMSAFVGLPLSLFTYFAFWYGEIGREVAFHSRADGKSPLPPAVLAIVPGVHFYMIYRLAKLMTEMEAQNKYRSITPWVATLCGVFPPFALAYLQDAANRHWMLHTKHTLVKKRTDAEK
jgi:hypothetical protein